MTKDYSYKIGKNEAIRVTTYHSHSIHPRACLIYIHGFKGFKDWGFVPYLSNYFTNYGYLVITFNFTKNGIGVIKTEFTELDKFAENTISQEVFELNKIILACKNNEFGNYKNSCRIGLLGHSRGGGVALITASMNESVKAVATWAAVSKFDRFSKRQKEIWKKNGFLEVENLRTKQTMKMNVSFLLDIEKNSERSEQSRTSTESTFGKEISLNILRATSQFGKPLLIAHGDQDLSVPYKEAEAIYNASNKRLTELFTIHKCGHTFDTVHPFEKTNEKFEKLLSKTNEFFSKHLLN